MNVLWLAVADARGHLMRALLCRRALAERGVAVDIVTTGSDGARFAEAMGSAANVAFDAWRVAFDESQRIDRRRTRRRAVRYVLDPRLMLRDQRTLRSWNYDVIVNDFHPLLLWERPLGGRVPIVHVHGHNLWRAVARPFASGPANDVTEALLRRLRDRGDAVVEHHPRCTSRSRSGHVVRLPPIGPEPTRPRGEVRDEAGITSEETMAAVYLNPYFRDPEIAAHIERECHQAGVRWIGLAEGFAGRAGWRAYDSDWASTVAAADVLVAPAGMGSISLHQRLGIPLLGLLTDQPEQLANASMLDPRYCRFVSLDAQAPLAKAITETISLPRRTSSAAVVDTWADTFQELVFELAG